MNVRLSFLLIAVLVIFGGTFLVFQFTRAEDSPEDPPWLYKVDDSSIVQIEATYNGETMSYRKRPGGTTWYIVEDDGDEVPVLNEKWSGTPLLLSGPRVNRVLSQTVDNPEVYGLEPPKSIIKVTERSGLTYEFRMGDPTPDGQNQYAYLVGDPQLFTVPQIWAEVINRLVTEPPYPRLYYLGKDSTIVHIGVIDSEGNAIDYRRPLTREEWTVVGDPDTPISQERWRQEILPQLNRPPISQVVDDRLQNPEEYGLRPPRTRVLITSTGEEPYNFHLGTTTPDGQHRYAQIRGGSKLFAVPESWAQMLEGLASDPPYAAEPQEEAAESDY